MKQKPDVDSYAPYPGFYDLRAFDIPNKADFIGLWRLQEYLYSQEQQRQSGYRFLNMTELQDLSAKYQHTLFQYAIAKPDFL